MHDSKDKTVVHHLLFAAILDFGKATKVSHILLRQTNMRFNIILKHIGSKNMFILVL